MVVNQASSCYNIFGQSSQRTEATMAGRVHPRRTLRENPRVVLQAIPWRLLLLIPILLVAGIPAFLFGTRAGQRLLPALTNVFFNLSGPPPPPAPTPLLPFPRALPQPGSLLYT